MTVKLKPVTRDDVKPLFELKVKPEQQTFVATNEISLAQVHYETGSTPYVIWSDNTRVGLMVIIDMREHKHIEPDDDPNSIFLWRLLIAVEHQGKGYGSAAMAALFEIARDKGATAVETSVVEDNLAALKFYEQLGFSLTGKAIDDEPQLRKEFKAG